MKRTTVLLILALSKGPGFLTAADIEPPLTTYGGKITAALNSLKKGPYVNSNNTGDCADIATNMVALECTNEMGFLSYLAARTSSYHAFLKTAEETLVNNQPGSNASSSGSSSLVSKASVPEVIGVAVDAEALAQSTSGTTTTFTGNARGLFRYLTHKEVFPYCPQALTCDTAWSGAARRLSASLSLDNTNSSTTAAPTSGTTTSPSAATAPTSLSGSNWRMSSWGLQYQLPLGKLDANGPLFRKAWDRQMSTFASASSPSALAQAAQNANGQLSKAFDALEKSTAYRNWLALAKQDIVTMLGKTPTPSQEEFEVKLRQDLEGLAKIVQTDKLISDDQLAQTQAAVSEFFASREAVLAAVTGTLPGFSLAYTDSHPLNQANVSNFKLIFQLQPKPGKISLTANVAADIYDALPAGSQVGRWRDLQASAEADFTLPSRYGNPVLSFAGYYQYMATKAVLQIAAGDLAPGTSIQLNGSAPTLLAPAGNIWITQALLTFPIKNGAKIPVGVSYANRTELLTGSVIRAHIGVNFNFDSLFMK